MMKECVNNGHHYTRGTEIRRCISCGKRQYKYAGVWKDEPKATKVKAPGKDDPYQLSFKLQ